MKKEELSLSKRDKILVVLYEMSQAKHSTFKYEDVIVTLFKKHPEDFHLRGYPEYPDSFNQLAWGIYEIIYFYNNCHYWSYRFCKKENYRCYR